MLEQWRKKKETALACKSMLDLALRGGGDSYLTSPSFVCVLMMIGPLGQVGRAVPRALPMTSVLLKGMKHPMDQGYQV